MNTNGNIYTVVYTTVVVVLVAAILSFVSEVLKPKQDANVKAEAISQMLTAAGFFEKDELEALGNDKVLEEYKSVISDAILIDGEGKKVGELDKSKSEIYTTSDLKAQSKLIANGELSEMKLPVFIFDKDGEKVSVIPCYGAGLWGPIWGYLAFGPDLKTIRGAYFDHASETPGLGAKIKDDPSFRKEFQGKKVNFTDVDKSGEPAVFAVVKGGVPEGQENAVDAISGATITSQSLGRAINAWVEVYKPYMTAAAADIPVADTTAIHADSTNVAPAGALAN